jgi:hypothetical protein
MLTLSPLRQRVCVGFFAVQLPRRHLAGCRQLRRRSGTAHPVPLSRSVGHRACRQVLCCFVRCGRVLLRAAV